MEIKAGANAVKITPQTSQFLCGYPHVERYSNGVDTDLWSSSLFLDDGQTQLLMIANEILYLVKDRIKEIRTVINEKTGIPLQNILISCTHTHSGPITAPAAWVGGNGLVPDMMTIT